MSVTWNLPTEVDDLPRAFSRARPLYLSRKRVWQLPGGAGILAMRATAFIQALRATMRSLLSLLLDEDFAVLSCTWVSACFLLLLEGTWVGLMVLCLISGVQSLAGARTG